MDHERFDESCVCVCSVNTHFHEYKVMKMIYIYILFFSSLFCSDKWN